MKKVLKFFVQSNIILLCAFILYSSCGRSAPEKCDVPSQTIGATGIFIDMRLFIGPSNAGQGDCTFPDNTAFVNGLPNGFVREKADDPTKYVVEVSVSGACSDGKIWTKMYKKGDFTLVKIGNPNDIRFNLPNLPKSWSNEHTVIPTVLSPCVGSSVTCNNISNYRQKFDLGGDGGFTIKDASNGLTFVLKNPGSTLPRLLFQSTQVDCQ